MRRLLISLSVLLLGFGLVAAQSEEGSAPEGQTQLVDVPTVMLSDQGFLVDGSGMTLYLFTNDEQAASVCADACAVNWPPFVVGNSLVAGEGVDGDLLDRIERADGTMQVTYNGWPLYYFVQDVAPGDVLGQGVGGIWYVVDVEGNAIKQLAE